MEWEGLLAQQQSVGLLPAGTASLAVETGDPNRLLPELPCINKAPYASLIHSGRKSRNVLNSKVDKNNQGTLTLENLRILKGIDTHTWEDRSRKNGRQMTTRRNVYGWVNENGLVCRRRWKRGGLENRAWLMQTRTSTNYRWITNATAIFGLLSAS